jgi:hypothetical protein
MSINSRRGGARTCGAPPRRLSGRSGVANRSSDAARERIAGVLVEPARLRALAPVARVPVIGIPPISTPTLQISRIWRYRSFSAHLARTDTDLPRVEPSDAEVYAIDAALAGGLGPQQELASRSVGNQRAENWRDPAGTDPENGNLWRVCDMVGTLEQTLGRSHSAEGARKWRERWSELNEHQRSQYKQARGLRPRARS